jgi:hypothetical protein
LSKKLRRPTHHSVTLAAIKSGDFLNLTMKTIFTLFIIAHGFATLVFAQSAQRPRGITTVLLIADVGNGIIAAPPGSRMTVPPLEEVRLVVPEGWPYSIQWRKNNQPIPNATNRILTIPLATSTDSGTYTVTGAPSPFVLTGVDLEVAEPGHIGNFSSLVEVIPGRAPPVVGWILPGRVAKSLLIRAVGPSLARFGITDGAPRPRIRIFDGTGKEMFFVHPAVVIDWPAIYAAIGAFPLQGSDAIEFSGFTPGAYTIQVSDSGGQPGKVLLEIYELPSVLPSTITPVPLQ